MTANLNVGLSFMSPDDDAEITATVMGAGRYHSGAAVVACGGFMVAWHGADGRARAIATLERLAAELRAAP